MEMSNLQLLKKDFKELNRFLKLLLQRSRGRVLATKEPVGIDFLAQLSLNTSFVKKYTTWQAAVGTHITPKNKEETDTLLVHHVLLQEICAMFLGELTFFEKNPVARQFQSVINTFYTREIKAFIKKNFPVWEEFMSQDKKQSSSFAEKCAILKNIYSLLFSGIPEVQKDKAEGWLQEFLKNGQPSQTVATSVNLQVFPLNSLLQDWAMSDRKKTTSKSVVVWQSADWISCVFCHLIVEISKSQTQIEVNWKDILKETITREQEGLFFSTETEEKRADLMIGEENPSENYTTYAPFVKKVAACYGTEVAQEKPLWWVRWATDQLASSGTICWISSGKYIHDAAYQSFRKRLYKDFSRIYVIESPNCRTCYFFQKETNTTDKKVYYTFEEDIYKKKWDAISWKEVEIDEEGYWRDSTGNNFENGIPLYKRETPEKTLFREYFLFKKLKKDGWGYGEVALQEKINLLEEAPRKKNKKEKTQTSYALWQTSEGEIHTSEVTTQENKIGVAAFFAPFVPGYFYPNYTKNPFLKNLRNVFGDGLQQENLFLAYSPQMPFPWVGKRLTNFSLSEMYLFPLYVMEEQGLCRRDNIQTLMWEELIAYYASIEQQTESSNKFNLNRLLDFSEFEHCHVEEDLAFEIRQLTQLEQSKEVMHLWKKINTPQENTPIQLEKVAKIFEQVKLFFDRVGKRLTKSKESYEILNTYFEEGEEALKELRQQLEATMRKMKSPNREITTKDIFNYVVAILFHPGYRVLFHANLQYNLPHIPRKDDFWKWVAWGAKLVDLQTNFEQVAPHPVEITEKEAEKNTTSLKIGIHKIEGKIVLWAGQKKVEISSIPIRVWNWESAKESVLEEVLHQYKYFYNHTYTQVTLLDVFPDIQKELTDGIRRLLTVSLQIVEIQESMELEPL